MEYKKLSEIAEIQSGLVLSRKEARFDSQQPIEYMKVNLRSINDDGTIDEGSLDQYVANEKLEEQFITTLDDIIIRLFPPFRPALITKFFTGLVIPSQFAIVRLKTSDIIPRFLCCYLSYRNLLESLSIRESGHTLGGIKISALSGVKIPLIAIGKQKAISAYSEINKNQKQRYIDLIQQYDLKMDVVISRAIGGM